jgi:hypothetical protein
MDLWSLSDLVWFRGPVPSLGDVYAFNQDLSNKLGRPCHGYRIKDKRTRRVTLPLVGGETYTAGAKSELWLYGVGSPVRRAFSTEDNRVMVRAACERFDAEPADRQANIGSLL